MPSASQAVAGFFSPFGLSPRDVEGRLRPMRLARQAFLMRPGDAPDVIGLVLEGVVREYYPLDDGVERTRGFSLAGQPFGSLSDALSKRPSRVFVRAERPSQVLVGSWAEVERLAAKSLAWQRFRSAIIEQLYLRKSTREYELLALDAMGRYQSLLVQHPTLETQVPLQLVASYLGITPVHLSRLRSRKRPATKRETPPARR